MHHIWSEWIRYYYHLSRKELETGDFFFFFSYLYSHLSFHFSCLMVYVVLIEKQFKNKPENVRIQQDQNLTLPMLQLINIRIRKFKKNVVHI